MEQYFIIAIIVTILVLILFTYGVYKNVRFIDHIMRSVTTPFQKIMYVLFMYLCSYIYICIVLWLDGIWASFICSIALLLIVTIFDYFFEWLFKGSNVDYSYKKWAVIISYVAVFISGVFIFVQYDSVIYLQTSSIALSVLIGSFIPVLLFIKDNTKNTENLRILLQKIIYEVVKKKRERWLTILFKKLVMSIFCILFLSVFMLICYSPYGEIINQIASGIGMGLVLFLVCFVIYAYRQSGKIKL